MSGAFSPKSDWHHAAPIVLPPVSAVSQPEQQSATKPDPSETATEKLAKRLREMNTGDQSATTKPSSSALPETATEKLSKRLRKMSSGDQSSATNGSVPLCSFIRYYSTPLPLPSESAKQHSPKRARVEASSSRIVESPERTLASTVGRGSTQASANGVNGKGPQLPSISAPVPQRAISASRPPSPRPSSSNGADIDMDCGSSLCLARRGIPC